MTVLAQPALAPAITEILSEVRVGPIETSVIVGDKTLEAESMPKLRHDLAAMLYQDLHAGVTDAGDASRSPRRDWDLEGLLGDCVPHATSPVEAVVRSPRTGSEDAEPVVEIGRVRVRVPAGIALAGTPREDRVLLGLPAIRPALSPGFLLVTGSAGAPAPQGDVLRMYVHLEDAVSAIAVWSAALEVLESRTARYRAKVLSKRATFPRRDALVIYLTRESWGHAARVAEAVRDLPGVLAPTSPLTRRVAPGIAIAWDPRDPRPGWERMSFGQHRTSALADGIVRHLARGVPVAEAAAEALADGAIDPSDPARNADSPDYPLGHAR